MGRITKKEKGKPTHVKFKDGTAISLQYEDDVVHIYEMIDGEAGEKICTQDMAIFRNINDLVQDSKTFPEVKRRLKVLFTPGQKKTSEPKREEDPFKHQWLQFQVLVQSVYPEPKPSDARPKEIQGIVFAVMSAYLNMEDPNHAVVKSYLGSVKCRDIMRHPKDGLWLLRGIMKYSCRETPDELDQTMKTFRVKVADLRLHLEGNFYDPVSFNNDIDAADDFLEAAGKALKEEDPAGAVVQCENAISAAVNHLDGYYRLAEIFLAKGDFTGALDALIRIEKMPMAERVFKERDDFYVLFRTLCDKVSDPAAAARYRGRLEAIAAQHGKAL